MPPRRSARHSAAAAPPVLAPTPATAPTPPPPIALPRSAPRIAWNISEIRREILLLLAPSDLARTLRTEKGCMKNVVGVLYRKMTYAGAEKIKSVDPARKAMYIQAITELDARSMKISPAMRQLPGWRAKFGDKDRVPDCVTRYDKTAFNFVVPYLRDRYRGLRKIVLGTAEPHRNGLAMSWSVVTFDKAFEADSLSGPDVYDDWGYKGELGGHIACYWPRWGFYMVSDVPKPLLEFPGLPKGKYTITHRFNTSFNSRWDSSEDITAECANKWLTAIREDKGFEDLYTDIEIFSLPLPLDLLTHLYKQQIAAGHVDRLQTIRATMMPPWSINEFASFATVATTLTSLDVSQGGYRSSRPLITFRDLPALVSNIRSCLPNLVKLTLDVYGVKEAETVCGAQLTGESISTGGTVKELQILTGLWNGDVKVNTLPSLFNTIRVLSAICTPQACITVSHQEEEHPWGNSQTAYLQYLLRQPATARRHLSIVDFSSLGVKHYREVLTLDYDAQGWPVKPTRNAEEKEMTSAWLDDFVEASGDMDDIDEGGLDDCAEAFQALDEIAGGATVREKRMRAKKLLKSMIPLKERVEALNASLDVEAVQKYITSLGQ